ncbi:hypothetical protein PROPEN_01580 [Proteus penneri ATCC 35198]|nr:hypothetical protein PROPEN_01580 [Proteus penneri ATCC 35198]
MVKFCNKRVLLYLLKQTKYHKLFCLCYVNSYTDTKDTFLYSKGPRKRAFFFVVLFLYLTLLFFSFIFSLNFFYFFLQLITSYKLTDWLFLLFLRRQKS